MVPDLPLTGSRTDARPAQDWRIPVAVFWVTSLVESMGVAQIFALLPAYLRQMGVDEADRLAFVGLFSSLVFVVGLPLVPLWGVWADKYSRKAVIVRSALVEAVVFACVALSREPWQLALSMLLIGFQLGNTGVMLAGIRDVTPLRRLGVTIALFGSSGPIGFAFGPALAGILVDGFGWSLPGVVWLYWSGSPGRGTFFLIWTVVVLLMDNVLRPWLITRGANLPILLIFAGVIGGLLGFGVIGLFIGPVILAVSYTLLQALVLEGTTTVAGSPSSAAVPVSPPAA